MSGPNDADPADGAVSRHSAITPSHGPRRLPLILSRQTLAGCLTAFAALALHDTDHIPIAAGTVILWASLLALRPLSATPALKTGARDVVEAAGFTYAIAAGATAVGVLSVDILLPTLAAVLIAAAAATAFSVLEHFRRRPARVVIVGDPVAVAAEESRWRDRPGIELIGSFVRSNGKADSPGRDGFAALVRSLGIDIVIVVPGAAYSAEDLQSLSWGLEQTEATIVLAGVLDRLAPHRLRAGAFGGVPVVALTPTRWSWANRALKAALDRLGAALLLVVLAPFMAALALLIRLDSPGPAVFKQRRVGQAARSFVMYKFRTMHTSDKAMTVVPLQRTAGNEVLFKMQEDPRVTRVGRVLRRLSLDELPQLVNVLRGEMSLVGPRPALYEEVAKYDSQAWRRTAVKPGITGLWQVSGRSDLSWEKSIALDVDYVDNWRPAYDLSIVARTAWAVVSRKGAY